jgi:TonB family protein
VRPIPLSSPIWRVCLRPSLLPFLLVAGAAGCASPGPSRPQPVHPESLTAEERARILLSDAAVPAGPGCTVSTGEAPAFSSRADSAAIAASLSRLAAEPGVPVGTVLLSVRADSLGELEWAMVLDSDLPAEVAALVPDLLEGRLKPDMADTDDGPRARGWSHRFRMTVAPEPSFQVGFPIACRPRLLNEGEVSRELTREAEASGHPLRSRIRERPTLLFIFVTEEGEPAEIRIEGTSGVAALDRISADVARQARFQPATTDGRPVPVWISIRFAIVTEPPAR